MSSFDLTEKIKEAADDIGVDIIRFISPEPFENYALSESPRRNPFITLPDAQTLIICGIDIGGIKLPDRSNPSIGQFSRLIFSGFYFDVVTPLESIANLLKEAGHKAVICDGYNANSVLPLKLAAVRAGFGWQGKNSLLITKEYGSFLALGGIITNAYLDRDKVTPSQNLCGRCMACQSSCPVNALEEPYKLNVNKCLSNSLEEEELSETTKSAMENRVAECDSCQLGCPWNQKHLNNPVKSSSRWAITERFGDMNEFFKLSNLNKLTEAEYNQYFGHLAGIDYKMFQRNVTAVIQNVKPGHPDQGNRHN